MDSHDESRPVQLPPASAISYFDGNRKYKRGLDMSRSITAIAQKKSGWTMKNVKVASNQDLLREEAKANHTQ